MFILDGINISSRQVKKISQMMSNLSNEAIFIYPWKNLENEFKSRKQSTISIVVYGSLINTSSASKTISEKSLSEYLPVIAFGVRRIFNYEMPADIKRYDPPVEPDARAALNVRVTEKLDDLVNGALIEVNLNDIQPMRERELDYDLVPIVCIKWDQLEGEPFMAYILRCPDKRMEMKRYTNINISPHRQYYLLCRNGAKVIGEQFLKLWLRTTYLADGITPVAEWEKEMFQLCDL